MSFSYNLQLDVHCVIKTPIYNHRDSQKDKNKLSVFLYQLAINLNNLQHILIVIHLNPSHKLLLWMDSDGEVERRYCNQVRWTHQNPDSGRRPITARNRHLHNPSISASNIRRKRHLLLYRLQLIRILDGTHCDQRLSYNSSLGKGAIKYELYFQG